MGNAVGYVFIALLIGGALWLVGMVIYMIFEVYRQEGSIKGTVIIVSVPVAFAAFVVAMFLFLRLILPDSLFSKPTLPDGPHGPPLLEEACIVTPHPVVTDVNKAAPAEVTIKLDKSGCAFLRADPGGRAIRVSPLVKIELSNAGFNGQIVPVGADTQPLDADRPEAEWKWTIKADVPGVYNQSLIVTSQDSDARLYLQDVRSTVNIRIESTFEYRASRIGRWLKEAVETTQGIVTGSAAIGAVLATLLFTKWQNRRERKGERQRAEKAPPRPNRLRLPIPQHRRLRRRNRAQAHRSTPMVLLLEYVAPSESKRAHDHRTPPLIAENAPL